MDNCILNSLWKISSIVIIDYRVVVTIRKHIVTQEILTRGGEGIRIDESADSGIVISALQVVEPGFSVVVVTVPFVEAIISHFKSLRKTENEPNVTK